MTTEAKAPADAQGETEQTPEWIVYQIGGPDRDKYRFIVTRGFQDMAVTAALKPFEFIDTTTTLLDEFGGDVTVLAFDELLEACDEALKYLNTFVEEAYPTDGYATACQTLVAALNKAEGSEQA